MIKQLSIYTLGFLAFTFTEIGPGFGTNLRLSRGADQPIKVKNHYPRDKNVRINLLCSWDPSCCGGTYGGGLCSKLKESDGTIKEPSPNLIAAMKILAPSIVKWSKIFKVDPRAVMGAVLAENTMNVGVDDRVQDWLAKSGFIKGGKILGVSTSVGWGQLNSGPAADAEDYAFSKGIRFPGQSKKNKATADEIQTALLIPESAMYYVAALTAYNQEIYLKGGYDVSNSPEILATLYNIGQPQHYVKVVKEEKRNPRPNYFGMFVLNNLEKMEEIINPFLMAEKKASEKLKKKIVKKAVVKKNTLLSNVKKSGTEKQPPVHSEKNSKNNLVIHKKEPVKKHVSTKHEKQKSVPAIVEKKLNQESIAQSDTEVEDVVEIIPEAKPLVTRHAVVSEKSFDLFYAVAKCNEKNSHMSDWDIAEKIAQFPTNKIVEKGDEIHELQTTYDCAGKPWRFIETVSGKRGWVDEQILKERTSKALLTNKVCSEAYASECEAKFRKNKALQFLAEPLENNELTLQLLGPQGKIPNYQRPARDRCFLESTNGTPNSKSNAGVQYSNMPYPSSSTSSGFSNPYSGGGLMQQGPMQPGMSPVAIVNSVGSKGGGGISSKPGNNSTESSFYLEPAEIERKLRELLELKKTIIKELKLTTWEDARNPFLAARIDGVYRVFHNCLDARVIAYFDYSSCFVSGSSKEFNKEWDTLFTEIKGFLNKPNYRKIFKFASDFDLIEEKIINDYSFGPDKLRSPIYYPEDHPVENEQKLKNEIKKKLEICERIKKYLSPGEKDYYEQLLNKYFDLPVNSRAFLNSIKYFQEDLPDTCSNVYEILFNQKAENTIPSSFDCSSYSLNTDGFQRQLTLPVIQTIVKDLTQEEKIEYVTGEFTGRNYRYISSNIENAYQDCVVEKNSPQCLRISKPKISNGDKKGNVGSTNDTQKEDLEECGYDRKKNVDWIVDTLNKNTCAKAVYFPDLTLVNYLTFKHPSTKGKVFYRPFLNADSGLELKDRFSIVLETSRCKDGVKK